MSDPAIFESREVKINKDIESEVAKIRANAEFELPKSDAEIVHGFVRKIEGSYNVDRAKKDTDNAIDLLYIAYNTTPQEEGDIRVKISAIMDQLIKSQQNSERTMREASHVANNILHALSDIFPDWRDVKEGNDAKEIKGFVGKDLFKLANEIKGKALDIQKALNAIADAYDKIIKDTVAATSTSEKALSARLKEKAAIEKEINEANAERERLESLVKDLQDEVAKFEKKARDYESRAETAEERAFVMSIIRVGAQMVSAAMPAVAMALGGAATGGTSILAASTLNTVKRVAGDKEGGAKEDGTAEQIETKKEISKKQAEMTASEEKKKELNKKIEKLEEEKAKLVAAKGEDGGSSEPETDAGASSSAEVKALDERINAAKTELDAETKKYSEIGTVLAGLKASLDALDKNLGKLTDEQQQQAASLREIQMKMLDKVEAYEKEKRGQTAELVKIKALLKGKRSEEETIQLAIKSLNLSVSALKRMKEIVEEIAFFFKSFADFMGQVSDEAAQQVKNIESVAEMETLRKNRLARLIESTDEFFIKQAGEWNAVTIVSDKFTRNFADGWSKLNKLNGTYIKGDELDAYLQTASAKLTEIVAEREAAADRKIADLEGYRKQIIASAGA